MKGGGVDIEKITKLTNKYIKYLFHHYNERKEWDVSDERLRLDIVEQYMDDIETHKKNLKRFFGSTAMNSEETFTDESIRYVAKIDNLFEGFKTGNPVPEAAELSNITLTEGQVNELYKSLGGGALKKRGKKTPKLKRKKKGKTNNNSKYKITPRKKSRRTTSKSRRIKRTKRTRRIKKIQDGGDLTSAQIQEKISKLYKLYGAWSDWNPQKARELETIILSLNMCVDPSLHKFLKDITERCTYLGDCSDTREIYDMTVVELEELITRRGLKHDGLSPAELLTRAYEATLEYLSWKGWAQQRPMLTKEQREEAAADALEIKYILYKVDIFKMDQLVEKMNQMKQSFVNSVKKGSEVRRTASRSWLTAVDGLDEVAQVDVVRSLFKNTMLQQLRTTSDFDHKWVKVISDNLTMWVDEYAEENVNLYKSSTPCTRLINLFIKQGINNTYITQNDVSESVDNVSKMLGWLRNKLEDLMRWRDRYRHDVASIRLKAHTAAEEAQRDSDFFQSQVAWLIIGDIIRVIDKNSAQLKAKDKSYYLSS